MNDFNNQKKGISKILNVIEKTPSLVGVILSLLGTVFGLSHEITIFFSAIELIICILFIVIFILNNSKKKKRLPEKLTLILMVIYIMVTLLLIAIVIYINFFTDYTDMKLMANIVRCPYLSNNINNDEFEKYMVKGEWNVKNFNHNLKKFEYDIKVYKIDDSDNSWIGNAECYYSWQECIDCGYLHESSDSQVHTHELNKPLHGTFTIDLSGDIPATPGEYMCEILICVNNIELSDELLFRIY